MKTQGMMDFSKVKLEHIFFITALLLAALVRFLNLGVAPLSDPEARLVLDAWQLAQGAVGVGEFHPAPFPGYILITSLLFNLLEPTNFLARFLPALAGMCLLLVPIWLRDMLGKPAAILLAFGLALDPGLVAASRLASGPMMALAFGLLAAICWQQGRPRLSGSPRCAYAAFRAAGVPGDHPGADYIAGPALDLKTGCCGRAATRKRPAYSFTVHPGTQYSGDQPDLDWHALPSGTARIGSPGKFTPGIF